MPISKYGKARTPEYKRNYNIEWSQKNPERYLWLSCKQRSKREGLDFDIEVSDIHIPLVCPILNIVLTKVRDGNVFTSPSIDRKNNTLGYVKGNIFVISTKANKHKSDMTKEDIKRLYEYVSDET